MGKKFKIVIAGIGGVGGYIGGKLAFHYQNHPDIEIIFIARGLNEITIKKSGLKLITSTGENICYPTKVTHEPNEAGKANLLICCVKNFDLEEGMKFLKPCINSNTIILPFQNGLDASEKIKTWYSTTVALNSCIYVVSRLIAPGVVKQTGRINQIYFGTNRPVSEKIKFVETIFKEASLKAEASNEILRLEWEKFFFISTVATATSYLDVSIGKLLEVEGNRTMLTGLMKELKSLADKQGIYLSNQTFKQSFDKIASMPYDATSSMHDDFKKGNKTELDSLTGYVVALGERLNIATPLYKQMFIELNKRLINLYQ